MNEVLSTLSEEESKTLTVQGMRKGVTSVPEPHAKPRKVVKETMESQDSEEGSGRRRVLNKQPWLSHLLCRTVLCGPLKPSKALLAMVFLMLKK